jgi:hypothetical protein
LGPLSRRHLHRLRCFYRIDRVGASVPSPIFQPLPHSVCQTAVCCANRPPGALRAAG